MMENTDQQTRFVQNPPENHSSPNVINNKRGKVRIIVVLMLIVGAVAYFSGTRSNNPQTAQQKQQINQPAPALLNTTPKLVTFMRNGDILTRDFATDIEVKVSKTSKVEAPRLSYNGKYVAYFSIVHTGSGLPRGNLYMTDTKNGIETVLGLTDEYASRLIWSKQNNFVGYILFPDGQASRAVLYDVDLRKIITEVEVISRRADGLTTDKSYEASLNCNQLDTKYVNFCKEYETVLNTNAKPYESYNSEKYAKSQYAKPNYNLTSAKKLDNGLVILEFYTGEPQNPESKWGIGGGIFVPGYDEGVTQTYTILLDESTEKVVEELPLAIDTDWIF